MIEVTSPKFIINGEKYYIKCEYKLVEETKFLNVPFYKKHITLMLVDESYNNCIYKRIYEIEEEEFNTIVDYFMDGYFTYTEQCKKDCDNLEKQLEKLVEEKF